MSAWHCQTRQSEGCRLVRCMKGCPLTGIHSQPRGFPGFLHAPVRVSGFGLSSWGPGFLVIPQPGDPSASVWSGRLHPLSPYGWKPGAPRCLSCLPVSLSVQEAGGPWCQRSPRVPFICQTAPITGARIFQMGVSSKNLQLDVMSLQGHRAETSKGERKSNPICPRRVESCMICRNLCTPVNLSLSLGRLSPGRGRDQAGRKPAPRPLSSDGRRDDVSSLAGSKEPGRAVLLQEGLV